MKWIGQVLTAIYPVFLTSITFFPKIWAVISWLVFYTAIEIKQMIGLWKGSLGELVKEYSSFWNTLDILRIASLLAYLICANIDKIDKVSKDNITAIMTIVAWMCSLEQLRMYKQFQFILTLLKKSFVDMTYFTIVLLIINKGFAFGYLKTLDQCWSWIDNTCSDQVAEEYEISNMSLVSYLILFGDFGEFQLDTGF